MRNSHGDIGDEGFIELLMEIHMMVNKEKVDLDVGTL